MSEVEMMVKQAQSRQPGQQRELPIKPPTPHFFPRRETIVECLERLNQAVADVNGLAMSLAECEAKLLYAEDALVAARTAMILKHFDNPKALGANEDQREANLYALTNSERAAVLECKYDKILIQGKLDRARRTLEQMRDAIRMAEVVAKQ